LKSSKEFKRASKTFKPSKMHAPKNHQGRDTSNMKEAITRLRGQNLVMMQPMILTIQLESLTVRLLTLTTLLNLKTRSKRVKMKLSKLKRTRRPGFS